MRRKLRDSPRSNPSHRSPHPQPGITYHQQGGQPGRDQIPGSAARWMGHLSPSPCPRSAGCRAGYHCLHPLFLFAPLSNHADRWLADKLAQAHPGDPWAHPSPVVSCCSGCAELRLHRGDPSGCTFPPRDPANGTKPMEPFLCCFVCGGCPPWGHLWARCCRKRSRVKGPVAPQSFSCCWV